jgi:hypothetical protein
LNIQESLMPVLVLKVVEKGTSQSDTPANKRPEWIALELYKGTADDSDTDSEAEITEELDHLHLESSSLPPTPIKPKRKEQQLLKEQEDYSLGHLCLLEYMLRLCALETRELKSHTQASDELLLHYLANTKRVQSFTAQPRNIESPGMVVKGGRLMDRFLNG